MKRVAAVAAMAMVAAGGLVLASPAEPAAAAPGAACTSSFYWVQSSQLNSFDPATTPPTVTPLGPSAAGDYNALGHNSQDGYLYALGRSAGIRHQLLQISDDGTVTELGIPAGLPDSGDFVAGDFDQNGVLWVASGISVTTLYGIDVATNTATPLPLSSAILPAQDFAYFDGKLYSVTSSFSGAQPSRVLAIDLATGVVTTSEPLSGSLSGAPALFSNSSGHLYVAHAGTRTVYEVLDFTSATPSMAALATGVTVTAGDGAGCHTAPSPFLAATDDDYTSTTLPLTGGTHTGILGNDTLRGAPVTSAAVTTTLLDEGGLTGATLSAAGDLTVPAAAAGTYRLTYRICDVTIPTLCDDAVITVVLAGSTPSAPAPTGPVLPPTGTEPAWGLSIAQAALVAAGALLVAVGRRRRSPRQRSLRA